MHWSFFKKHTFGHYSHRLATGGVLDVDDLGDAGDLGGHVPLARDDLVGGMTVSMEPATGLSAMRALTVMTLELAARRPPAAMISSPLPLRVELFILFLSSSSSLMLRFLNPAIQEKF